MYMFFRKLVEIWFKHIKFKMTVLNQENIPSQSGGFIVASNHLTYSDPPVIAAVFKGKFSFMAKSELFKNKLFAWLITKCGAFPVVRGAKDGAAIERAVKDLENNRIFVIFPEGTRSKNGTIARAKSGVALIAGKTGAPIVPICIMYGAGGKKRDCTVAVGKMISSDQTNIEDTNDRSRMKAVTSLITDNICALQKQICDKYNIPVPGTEASS